MTNQRSRVSQRLFAMVALAILPVPRCAGDELATAVQAATRQVADAVLRIQVIGGPAEDASSVSSQVVTGLAVDEDGWVLTSMFGFTTDPAAIFIQTAGGQRLPARLVARDHLRKLVLLKCDELTVKPPRWSDERWPQVGEWSIALGRLYPTEIPAISVGIVSAVGRIFDLAIQTDAKISPVNYGGPLVDLQGRVLGILVPLSPSDAGEQIRAGVEWYDSGIGFAIPVTDALRVVRDLQSGEDRYRGRLGLKPATSNPLAPEVKVEFVQPDSPAAAAGFQAGDRIVAVNGIQVDRFGTLDAVLKRAYAGESVAFTVNRDDQTLQLKAELVDQLKTPKRGFIGLLIARDQSASDEKDPPPEKEENGVKVHVFPETPAAEAGLPDTIWVTRWNDSAVTAIDQLQPLLRTAAVGAEVSVQYRTAPAEDPQQATIRVGERPDQLLPVTELLRTAVVDNDDAISWEQREEALGEEGRAGSVWFYAPRADPSREQSSGMVVLLSEAETSREILLNRWRKTCERFNLILLVPSTAEDVELTRENAGLLPMAIAAALPGRGLEVSRSVLVADAAQAELCTDLLLNPRLRQFRAAVYLNSWPGISGLPPRLLTLKRPSVMLVPEPNESRERQALRGQTVQQLKEAGSWVLQMPNLQDSIEEQIGIWTISLRAQ